MVDRRHSHMERKLQGHMHKGNKGCMYVSVLSVASVH